MPIRTDRKSKTSRSRSTKPENPAARNQESDRANGPRITKTHSSVEISDAEVVKRSNMLVEQVCKVLHGEHFHTQGMTLAELVGLYLAGFPNFMRDGLLQHHCNLARELCDAHKFVVHGPTGRHPQDVDEASLETRQ